MIQNLLSVNEKTTGFVMMEGFWVCGVCWIRSTGHCIECDATHYTGFNCCIVAGLRFHIVAFVSPAIRLKRFNTHNDALARTLLIATRWNLIQLCKNPIASAIFYSQLTIQRCEMKSSNQLICAGWKATQPLRRWTIETFAKKKRIVHS